MKLAATLQKAMLRLPMMTSAARCHGIRLPVMAPAAGFVGLRLPRLMSVSMSAGDAFHS